MIVAQSAQRDTLVTLSGCDIRDRVHNLPAATLDQPPRLSS